MAGQGFELEQGGRRHRLDVSNAGISREYVWTCDGEEVARQKSMDDRWTLRSEGDGVSGEIRIRSGLLGVQRATLVTEGRDVDMVPDAGSRAARREERIRAHPHRHVALHTTAALAKVLIPLLGVGLVISFLPDWDLPSLPLPDWDLPSIPWPDWSLPHFSIEVPEWIREVMSKLKYVWPVLLALGLATGEVRRRREHDERRRADDATEEEPEPSEPPSDESSEESERDA